MEGFSSPPFFFIFIAVISLHSFLLLVRAKLVVPGSFGDIGGALYGPWMRHLILNSIVLSQIGFVRAYMIFVSENLQAFASSVTNCVQYVPVKYFILIQTLIFLPFSLLRDIVQRHWWQTLTS
ncbi:transmembrane amino acid transporter protein-domain-containing protein [Lentinula detonsa]|uniref:Transmembrane amino acid transporter protein-domain-containing protein n=1 Tax=Lentinula detonsa TaxID=2804962 RepID=A0A9W8NTI4_9AGAR|nr:transmembrane amino acid transporter protein-domain-containing protein [Lentinula detonsa]